MTICPSVSTSPRFHRIFPCPTDTFPLSTDGKGDDNGPCKIGNGHGSGGIRESQLHSTISTDGTPLGGGLAKIMMVKYRTGARRYADGAAEINHVSGICGSLCQSGAWAI